MTLQKFAKISRFCKIEHNLSSFTSITMGNIRCHLEGIITRLGRLCAFLFYSNLITILLKMTLQQFAKISHFCKTELNLSSFTSSTMGNIRCHLEGIITRLGRLCAFRFYSNLITIWLTMMLQLLAEISTFLNIEQNLSSYISVTMWNREVLFEEYQH